MVLFMQFCSRHIIISTLMIVFPLLYKSVCNTLIKFYQASNKLHTFCMCTTKPHKLSNVIKFMKIDWKVVDSLVLHNTTKQPTERTSEIECMKSKQTVRWYTIWNCIAIQYEIFFFYTRNLVMQVSLMGYDAIFV